MKKFNTFTAPITKQIEATSVIMFRRMNDTNITQMTNLFNEFIYLFKS